jgi:hypothetical protein
MIKIKLTEQDLGSGWQPRISPHDARLIVVRGGAKITIEHSPPIFLTAKYYCVDFSPFFLKCEMTPHLKNQLQ